MSPTGEQTTLARPVSKDGVGLHTGQKCALTILPAPPNAGIVFVSPAGDEIPATVEHVLDTDRGTTLGTAQTRVRSVEHLMAALYGMGVDNARIELEGPEAPACDGSAIEWVRLVQRAGRAGLGVTRQAPALAQPVWVDAQPGWAVVLPARGALSLAVAVDFSGTVVGKQTLFLRLTRARFIRELAPARTFVDLKDLDELRARGLAQGGASENAFAFGPQGYSGPLRFPDEVVRHKALDLLGDLALCGCRFAGQVVAVRPGHRLNLALAAALRKELLAHAQA